jgi:3-hydroxyisobutyrate dehydrogenase
MRQTVAKIAFVGLGKMGLPMAQNLVKAGHQVTGFDLSAAAGKAWQDAGGTLAPSLADAVAGADFVVSMVNTGKHVRSLYCDAGGVIAVAPKSAMLVDCSTIDVETARAVAKSADDAGFVMVDAPVSGGVMGAAAATLTFMVGGPEAAFERVQPILAGMGRNIVHAGPSGNGQAAKICNNMMVGIHVVSTSEAMALGMKLGLDPMTFFKIASTSSGQSWALTTYCPVPGPVPTSPANKDYEPGFSTDLMLKDMRLSQEAANAVGASTPLGACVASIYQAMVNNGYGSKDFSIVAKLLSGELGLAAKKEPG